MRMKEKEFFEIEEMTKNNRPENAAFYREENVRLPHTTRILLHIYDENFNEIAFFRLQTTDALEGLQQIDFKKAKDDPFKKLFYDFEDLNDEFVILTRRKDALDTARAAAKTLMPKKWKYQR